MFTIPTPGDEIAWNIEDVDASHLGDGVLLSTPWVFHHPTPGDDPATDSTVATIDHSLASTTNVMTTTVTLTELDTTTNMPKTVTDTVDLSSIRNVPNGTNTIADIVKVPIWNYQTEQFELGYIGTDSIINRQHHAFRSSFDRHHRPASHRVGQRGERGGSAVPEIRQQQHFHMGRSAGTP